MIWNKNMTKKKSMLLAVRYSSGAKAPPKEVFSQISLPEVFAHFEGFISKESMIIFPEKDTKFEKSILSFTMTSRVFTAIPSRYLTIAVFCCGNINLTECECGLLRSIGLP